MNTSSTPTIYCDVDGVLNVYAKDALLKRIVARRRLPSLGLWLPRFPLRFSWYEEIADSLSSDIAGLALNFMWLTTWNEDAVTVIEPLTGIRSTGVLSYRMSMREVGSQSSKYKLLRAHQELQPSPFIWIDDVATKHYNKDDWDNHHEHLVIRTNKRQGITKEHLISMRKFVAELS